MSWTPRDPYDYFQYPNNVNTPYGISCVLDFSTQFIKIN